MKQGEMDDGGERDNSCEGDTERERQEERNSEGENKKKTPLKQRQGRAHLREMGEETVFVIAHTHTYRHTCKYFVLFRGALMKLSR